MSRVEGTDEGIENAVGTGAGTAPQDGGEGGPRAERAGEAANASNGAGDAHDAHDAENSEDSEGAAKDSADAKDPKAKGKGGGWRESVLLIAGGVVAALLLRTFVIGTFWIPSESMENTLLENDRVLVNRLAGSYQRGDIVVFKGWDGTDWIKRVIAVGGDTVKCCDAKHRLSVNGVPVDETYLYPGNYASGDSFEVKVPKGRLWVMGDHRVASRDSRAFIKDRFSGTISEDAVLGRAWAVYWPPSRVKLLDDDGAFDKVR